MTDPVIILAGRAWPIPLLAPRQNRIVVPLLLSLPQRPEDNYGALLDIAFSALTRASPYLAREDFEDLPIATWELVDAISIIGKQTGLMKPAQRLASAPSVKRPDEAQLPDWDAIIAQFCNFLPGTTPDYWEDALTIPRLEAMNEQWRLHPPAPVLIAGYFGHRPKPRGLDSLEQLMRFFPDGRLRLN